MANNDARERVFDLDEVAARNEKAHTMIKDLCRPRNDPKTREWIMSIPARKDYDPDLVIGASLRDVPKLSAHIRELEAEVERLKGLVGMTCEWSWDLDYWAAGCNYQFISENGTLAENQIYFCPNCGGRIVGEA